MANIAENSSLMDSKEMSTTTVELTKKFLGLVIKDTEISKKEQTGT